MRFYELTYRVGEAVLYLGEEVKILEVKNYTGQTDLVVRLGNGKSVQVEDWKVEKT